MGKRTSTTRRHVYTSGDPEVAPTEETPSPIMPDPEDRPEGRYLKSFLDNWSEIMMTHTRALENRSLKGMDLDEYVGRHAMLVIHFSFNSWLLYFTKY